MREDALDPNPALIAALHTRKNAIYAELVADGAIIPRPGVVTLIQEARRRGVSLAIATTTSRANLIALLTHSFGPDADGWFSAIVAGEDVARKKPDPEVYRVVLEKLSIEPTSCVAIEDSRNGLEAALGAGIRTLVTPSRYSRDERFDGAVHVTDVHTGCDCITVRMLEEYLR